MDRWQKFKGTSLATKHCFNSNLTMKDITDTDYKLAKIVWENFGLQNLAQDHDLYVQSDTLLQADVFERFRNKCLKIYELDPVYFF